jgi:hypothetical protein
VVSKAVAERNAAYSHFHLQCIHHMDTEGGLPSRFAAHSDFLTNGGAGLRFLSFT